MAVFKARAPAVCKLETISLCPQESLVIRELHIIGKAVIWIYCWAWGWLFSGCALKRVIKKGVGVSEGSMT